MSGCEDGHVNLWDLKSGKPALSWEAHTGRLRGLVSVPSDSGTKAASAASNGSVRLWDLRAAAPDRPLAEVDLSTRITCLCLVDCQQRPVKHLASGSRPSVSGKGVGSTSGALRKQSELKGRAKVAATASRPGKRPPTKELREEASVPQDGVANAGVVEFPEPASTEQPRQASKKKKQRQKR